MKKNLLLTSALVLFLISVCAIPAFAEEKSTSWELVAGGGTSLDGDSFYHILVAPALTIDPPNRKILVYRIEADFELIKAAHSLTVVMGIAPFARLYLPHKKTGPFIELGAGANAITNNHTGIKNSGGVFVFSLMGGLGYRFTIGNRPFSLSVRARHLSNGHIYRINEGINSALLLASIGF